MHWEECRTNGSVCPQTGSGEESSREIAASVSAGALPGVVMATAPAGARAASPRGLSATGQTLPASRGRRGTGGEAKRGQPLGKVRGHGLGAAGRRQAMPFRPRLWRGSDRYRRGSTRGPADAGRVCCENCEPQGRVFLGVPPLLRAGRGR